MGQQLAGVPETETFHDQRNVRDKKSELGMTTH